LIKKGARVTYHDPFVSHIDAEHWAGSPHLDSVPYGREEVAAADCVVVATNHTAFDYDELVSAARLVVDTRNAVKISAPNVFKLGAPNPSG
jgi:UDP-N-acetyl-D-glucosamine dehydrogenase